MTVLAIDRAVLKTADRTAGLFGAQPELWTEYREAMNVWIAEVASNPEDDPEEATFELYSQALLGAYVVMAVVALLVALPVRSLPGPWGLAGALLLATIAGICSTMAIAHAMARVVIDTHTDTARLRFGFPTPLNVVVAAAIAAGFALALA